MRVPIPALLGLLLGAPSALAARPAEDPVQASAKFTETLFKGDPKQVMLACAEKARALAPRKERILAQVGRAYLVAENRPKAEAMFKGAVGGDAETQRLIGQAWLECGFKDEARAAFKNVPSRAGYYGKNALAAAAVNLMDGGLVQLAEDLMQIAFQLDPRDWQNVTAYGRACLRQGRQDLAAQWFAKIMTTRRKHEGLWNEIALALADGGAER